MTYVRLTLQLNLFSVGRLSPDLPRKTAIEYIRNKAKERWGDLKVVNFIQRTVPFVPLSAYEMKRVAEAALLQLEQVFVRIFIVITFHVGLDFDFSVCVGFDQIQL